MTFLPRVMQFSIIYAVLALATFASAIPIVHVTRFNVSNVALPILSRADPTRPVLIKYNFQNGQNSRKGVDIKANEMARDAVDAAFAVNFDTLGSADNHFKGPVAEAGTSSPLQINFGFIRDEDMEEEKWSGWVKLDGGQLRFEFTSPFGFSVSKTISTSEVRKKIEGLREKLGIRKLPTIRNKQSTYVP
ncbi:hypothetical protein C8J55DRAFT_186217 [Lentinula edodes]|uniref:Uncharacterized protein n=1 Tax=Lentinula lateritia TaxID=40482 RepID=A0A9W8ZYP4_9AGAR|nr:hypothetical protein C8J55DRAFT_186217 [Lentinula edodes]